MQYASEVIHPVSPQDASTMALLRTLVAPMKGKLQGISAREPFNALMEQVSIASVAWERAGRKIGRAHV